MVPTLLISMFCGVYTLSTDARIAGVATKGKRLALLGAFPAGVPGFFRFVPAGTACSSGLRDIHLSEIVATLHGYSAPHGPVADINHLFGTLLPEGGRSQRGPVWSPLQKTWHLAIQT